MMNEEATQTSVLADTSRSSSPSTFTDLQTVQMGAHHSFLIEGAHSGATAHASQCADGFSLPGYHQLLAWNQYRYLPFGCPGASSHSYDGDSAMMFPGVLRQKYSFLADLFEDGLANMPSGSAATVSAPLTPSPPTSPPAACHHQDQSLGKSNQTEQAQKKQAYIKKPLNAFMLFMKEQRPTVRPSIRCQGSGAVNAFLGSVWKSLSRKEQEKYYQEAEKERFLHQQQYPGWSNRENYGKMRTKAEKRKMQEAREDTDNASSEESFKFEGDETPPSKWMMLTPKYRDKFKNHYSTTHGMESRCQMTLRSRKCPNHHK